MKRYINIKATAADGSIVRKSVQRDMNVYPDTPDGTARLIEAINNKALPIINRPVEGAIIGYLNPKLSDNRTAVNGASVQTSRAPRLLSANRNAPRINGISYDLPAQDGLLVIKHERNEAIINSGKKVIIYANHLYANMADNNLLGRPWTHVAESCKWNGETYPTQFKRALITNYYVAATLGAQDTGDPRWTPDIQNELNAFANGGHVLLKTDAAARLMAKWWCNIFEQPDWYGGGIDYFSINHEVHIGTFQEFYHHNGILTRAIIDEWKARPKGNPNVKAGPYDFGNLVTAAPYFWDQPATSFQNGNPFPDPDPSIPQYMHFAIVEEPFRGGSQSAPLGTGTVLAQLLKDGLIYVGGANSYLQFTMDNDPNQSYYQKNSDGSFKLDGNGNPLFRTDERTATVHGQNITIWSEDYELAMNKLYGIVARICTAMFIMAGAKHMPKSTDRQVGFEKMLGQYGAFRSDAEGLPSVPRGDAEALNERALAAHLAQGHGMLLYLFCDYIMNWMSSQERIAFGADNNYGSKARAAVEQYAAGMITMSKLNFLETIPWQLCQPVFWIWKQGITGPQDPDSHFSRKPISIDGIFTKDGKPAMFSLLWVPTQDVNATTTFVKWVDKGGGPISPGYKMQVTGRFPIVDWWYLPQACAGMEPKDLYTQFDDLRKVVRTWRGDYRQPKITDNPTPPAIQELGFESAPTTGITRIRRRFTGTFISYDIRTVSTAVVPQYRQRVNGAAYTTWSDVQPRSGDGYTHFIDIVASGVGLTIDTQFRLGASDTNVITVSYTIQQGSIDPGTIVYPS